MASARSNGATAVVLGSTSIPPEFITPLTELNFRIAEVSLFDSLLQSLRCKPDLIMAHLDAMGEDPCGKLELLKGLKLTATLPIVAVGGSRNVGKPGRVSADLSEVLSEEDRGDIGRLLVLAAIRRDRPQVLTNVLHCGNVTYDPTTFTLSVDDKVASLRKTDLRMLGAMFDAPGRTWSRELLARVTFEPDRRKQGRDIDYHVSRVRRQVRAQTGYDPISSIRGVGYALNLHEGGMGQGRAIPP